MSGVAHAPLSLCAVSLQAYPYVGETHTQRRQTYELAHHGQRLSWDARHSAACLLRVSWLQSHAVTKPLRMMVTLLSSPQHRLLLFSKCV